MSYKLEFFSQKQIDANYIKVIEQDDLVLYYKIKQLGYHKDLSLFKQNCDKQVGEKIDEVSNIKQLIMNIDVKIFQIY